MRLAWSGLVSTVMVMRETSGFSVRPTVSESMLKARRRNSEATRVSTPGLFSTYTTKMFSIFTLFVRGGFNDGTGPPDHIVQRSTGRNHRVHRVFLLYLEVDQHGAVVLARRPHRRQHLRALGNGHAADAVSLGQFHEIGVQQRRGFIVALVEKFLPLTHHAEEAVIDDRNVDLQLFLLNGRKFGHGHLEAAVADDDPDFGVRPRYLGSDGRRQGEAHGSKATRCNQRPRFF